MLNVYTNSPCVIVPAAGLSRRFPGWKLGLPYRGEPLLARSLRLAGKVCENTILVVGHRSEEAKVIARAFPSVTVVYNPWYPLGLFSSILAAIPYVSGIGAYVLLPDMPLLARQHFELLRIDGSTDVARPVYRGDPGHPVYLSRRVLHRALSFPLTARMPEVLRLYKADGKPLADRAVVTDIDTLLDYQRLSLHSNKL